MSPCENFLFDWRNSLPGYSMKSKAYQGSDSSESPNGGGEMIESSEEW